uniref:Thyroid hormone receptor-associated protein complex subunit n=1 Tax=Macrostomum lignano TaxID=282301 RepID=A0A1I8IJC0_9PLAT
PGDTFKLLGNSPSPHAGSWQGEFISTPLASADLGSRSSKSRQRQTKAEKEEGAMSLADYIGHRRDAQKKAEEDFKRTNPTVKKMRLRGNWVVPEGYAANQTPTTQPRLQRQQTTVSTRTAAIAGTVQSESRQLQQQKSTAEQKGQTNSPVKSNSKTIQVQEEQKLNLSNNRNADTKATAATAVATSKTNEQVASTTVSQKQSEQMKAAAKAVSVEEKVNKSSSSDSRRTDRKATEERQESSKASKTSAAVVAAVATKSEIREAENGNSNKATTSAQKSNSVEKLSSAEKFVSSVKKSEVQKNTDSSSSTKDTKIENHKTAIAVAAERASNNESRKVSSKQFQNKSHTSDSKTVGKVEKQSTERAEDVKKTKSSKRESTNHLDSAQSRQLSAVTAAKIQLTILNKASTQEKATTSKQSSKVDELSVSHEAVATATKQSKSVQESETKHLGPLIEMLDSNVEKQLSSLLDGSSEGDSDPKYEATMKKILDQGFQNEVDAFLTSTGYE